MSFLKLSLVAAVVALSQQSHAAGIQYLGGPKTGQIYVGTSASPAVRASALNANADMVTSAHAPKGGIAARDPR